MQENFFNKVYKIVAQIPYGKVLSYGQIAKMLGVPRAARQVGWALSCCPNNLPWQRVLRADGTISGGYFADMRRTILLSEGVAFLDDGRVDMKKSCWNGKFV